MKLRIILFSLLLMSVSSWAQKPLKNYSCQHAKSHYGLKSAAANEDTRGDFIDIINYRIDLDISDFVNKEIEGFTQVTFMPIVDGVNSIELDLLDLDITSITLFDTTALAFVYDDTVMNIDFPTTLQKNFNYRIKVHYNGAPVQIPGDWGGFFWTNTYAYNIGVSFVQEEKNFGKAWFPCFDNFTERSTYDFLIKTRDDHKAFCNGVLQNEIDHLNGTKTWIWKFEQEIPTYLANVAVANYATVEQSYNKLAGGSIPIELGARAVDTTNLKNSFIHLNDALLSYETRFGPYRFDRVGYCVTSFNAGAMEHATNITYMAAAVNGNTSLETLMAHELSHHWFGNNTTCETADDMWLNEGWASYAEAIFTESVYGTEAFKDYNRENHDEVLRQVHIYDGEYLPVSGVPADQTYSSTVYSKGADMAHTLRGILGDNIFFSAMKSFQNDYSFNHINTDLFQEYLSNYSSLNLTSFFNTWVKEKGFRHYEIAAIDVSESSGEYLVQGSIKQKLWEASTYTDFLPIPITFFDSDWNSYEEIAYVYGECSDFQFELDFEPIFWALDLDEDIQDATVDKYDVISTTGMHDFGFARINFDIQTISDSALIRAEHHYIKPDPMLNKIDDLHLSPNRYWSVSGIFPDGFSTNADFKFNGTTSNSDGNLDNDFITSSENDLVMLYRPDASTDWTLVTDFVVNTQGSATNKVGFITVNNVQKGDYVMGIYDTNLTQDASEKTECVFTSIVNLDRLNKLINVFPVPAKDFVTIEFLAPNTGVEKIKIFNILGSEIKNFSTNEVQKSVQVDTKTWNRGNYIISFLDVQDKTIFTKKIVIE